MWGHRHYIILKVVWGNTVGLPALYYTESGVVKRCGAPGLYYTEDGVGRHCGAPALYYTEGGVGRHCGAPSIILYWRWCGSTVWGPRHYIFLKVVCGDTVMPRHHIILKVVWGDTVGPPALYYTEGSVGQHQLLWRWPLTILITIVHFTLTIVIILSSTQQFTKQDFTSFLKRYFFFKFNH